MKSLPIAFVFAFVAAEADAGGFSLRERSAHAQGAIADLSDLQMGIDRGLDPLQLSRFLELQDEVAQVTILH